MEWRIPRGWASIDVGVADASVWSGAGRRTRSTRRPMPEASNYFAPDKGAYLIV